MKKLALLSAVFSVGVIACGGGGGDTTEPGGGDTTAPATATYLAYYKESGNIYLVDPDDLSTREIHTSPIISAASLIAVGSYDSTTGEYSDLHRHSIYWIEENDNDTTSLEGGPIYKLSLMKGDQAPQSQQISNINDACWIITFTDDLVGKKAYFEISTAGSDGSCLTGDEFFVHSEMNETSQAIDMSGIDLITSISGDQGSITGFLVFNSTSTAIEECDTDLANCTVLLPNSTLRWTGYFATNPGNGDIYICINQDLYLFNSTDISSLNVPCNPPFSEKWDSNAIYAIDDSGNIHKLPYDSNSWIQIYGGGDAYAVPEQTTTYLIVQTSSGVIAVEKDTGNTVSLTSGIIAGPPIGIINIGIENKAYFTVLDPATLVLKACTWTEDSSTADCQDNSYYAGLSLKTSGTLNLGSNLREIYRILRVDNSTFDTGGGTLYAIDPQTGDTTATLGDVPDGFYLFGVGIGNPMLLEGYEWANSQYDVFYVNLSQENSLTNITNSTNDNETEFSLLF